MGSLIVILVAAAVVWPIVSYHQKTKAVPSSGGVYSEGLIGQPRYINPLLAPYNDVDRDLSGLIFSGLLKYNCQGELIPDLAENYRISEDGKTYEVFLRKNLKWHDNEPLDADDVIYTIETIQDPAFNSPLRINWQGVNLEKIDQYAVRFILKTAYVPFLHHLTLGILPRHLWQGIDAVNFPLAQHHLEPVGSGPYQFKKLQKDRNGNIRYFELVRFDDYYQTLPKIETLGFKFYPNQEDGLAGFNKNEIDGLSYITASSKSKLQNISDVEIRLFQLPRYFAVFFNQTQSKVLSDTKVRLALNLATDKQELIEKILNGQATIIDSPLSVSHLVKEVATSTLSFDSEKAKEILETNGWQPGQQDESTTTPTVLMNDSGITVRQKKINHDTEATLLEIELTTTDWPELAQAATILKQQWEKIGARVNLNIVDLTTIQLDYIKTRTYQALLFGEILGPDPDPFAFWHSSQKKDPGLNLALYDNKKADKLLEEARQELKPDIRLQKYQEFQKILEEDAPAVFLYNPTYLYPVSNKIKGVNIERIYLPSQRFCQIEKWYIKTKRTPK